MAGGDDGVRGASPPMLELTREHAPGTDEPSVDRALISIAGARFVRRITVFVRNDDGSTEDVRQLVLPDDPIPLSVAITR